jgi:phytoene dehydrogenase-like protein
VSTTTPDAIVVGAGHNGLIAAAYLARAGWKVLVLERNDEIGGAVRSAEVTRPGFVHDLFATNLNLFLGSPVHAELGSELERHGLRYAHSPRPFANLFADGGALRVWADAERTLAGLRDHDPRDADGWRRLGDRYARLAPALFAAYASVMPSGELVTALRGLSPGGAADLVRLLASSPGGLAGEYLHSPQARALLTCWGLHLDFAPAVKGGALFPFLEAFTDQSVGMSIAQGGASHLPDALRGLIEQAGGEVRTGADVARVHVAGGRAQRIELASGEHITARRAVIANLTPAVLYGRLLAGQATGRAARAGARRYRYGPATMMVHLALSGPAPWTAGDDLREFAYLHIAPLSEDLSATYDAAQRGLLPSDPLLIVGQSSAVDPTRAPAGGHVLWVQVRTLPAAVRGDAAGTLAGGGDLSWDALAEPFADRVMAKLERYAPGLGERVLARRVLSPADLERSNPNLVGGDSLGGSMHPRQNFVLRPFPGVRPFGTGVRDLHMVGAATWPGAGVNALSGYHLAQRLIAGDRASVSGGAR